VVARGDHRELSDLLTNCMTSVNTIDIDENTALHHAVSTACHKCDWDDRFYQCIDLLMSCEQMNVNRPNDKGYTAIGLAARKPHKTCVEYMLRHPSADRLYLDYHPGDSESTVREIIMQTYPDLEAHLPAPLMEHLDSTDRDIKLLAALQHDKYNIFSENLDSNNPNPWYDEPYHSSLLEIACQMKNRQRFVELLLDNGADPNIKNRVTGMPLLNATARSGNFEALLILLKKLEIDISLRDNEKRTVLHWLAGVSERNLGDKQKIEYCLKLLLRSNNIRKKDIDDRDSSGNTALCTAVERGLRDRAKLLLNKGADIMVLEQGSKILLSASLPILEEILDDCLLSNDKPVTSKDLLLWFKNNFLMYIVPRIAESEHLKDLLIHPVISAFLILKWVNIRVFLFSDIAVYFIFLCILTAYILLNESHNTLNAFSVVSNTNGSLGFNDSYVISVMNDSEFISQWSDLGLDYMWHALWSLWCCLIGREMFHLTILRKAYLLLPEKWLMILLSVASFISFSGVVDSMEIKRHSSAIALLLGWFELLLMSGRMQRLSIKLEMLKTVSLTFFSFMAGYVLLLIAFGLSFYILFKGSLQQDSTLMFSNPLLSLLKTVYMLTRESDASSLSFETLPYTSHVIYLLFVYLMGIILLNLLNGLAVSDTHAIRTNAKMLSLVATARIISKFEKWIRLVPRRTILSALHTNELRAFYPNRPNSIGSTNLRPLLSIISKKRQANKKWESSVSEDKWSIFTQKFCALELRQEKLERKLDEAQQILMQILTRLDTA
jgi:ankyrin repeat protein